MSARRAIIDAITTWGFGSKRRNKKTNYYFIKYFFNHKNREIMVKSGILILPVSRKSMLYRHYWMPRRNISSAIEITEMYFVLK